MKLGNYKVRFQHDVQQGITNAEILTTDEVSLSFGTAIKGKKDAFHKEKGRRVALRKALLVADLTKEDRKEVWDAYNNRHTPTNIVDVTLKEGNSVISMKVDITSGKPVIGVSFAQHKHVNQPTLLTTVHNAILAGMGVDADTPVILHKEQE